MSCAGHKYIPLRPNSELRQCRCIYIPFICRGILEQDISIEVITYIHKYDIYIPVTYMHTRIASVLPVTEQGTVDYTL